VPDGQVRAADGRGQPGPAGQLAGACEPGDVTDLGEHDQHGELPGTGQRGQHLDPWICFRVLAQLRVDPADLRAQGAGERQAASHDFPWHDGQAQLGEPAAAQPGPVTAGPVIPMAGGHRVDPVAQLGAEPGQTGPVAQQRAELPHRRRGDPRLGQQVRAQQLRQDRRVHLVFSRAEAIALHRSGCTMCGPDPQSSRSSISQPQPQAASNATGVPAGRSPISLSIGSEPFTTFRLSWTFPSSATTATWDRLRCTSIPTQTDIAGPPFPELVPFTRSVLLPG